MSTRNSFYKSRLYLLGRQHHTSSFPSLPSSSLPSPLNLLSNSPLSLYKRLQGNIHSTDILLPAHSVKGCDSKMQSSITESNNWATFSIFAILQLKWLSYSSPYPNPDPTHILTLESFLFGSFAISEVSWKNKKQVD